MSVPEDIAANMMKTLVERDVDGAGELVERWPELSTVHGYQAHPVLRTFVVEENNGHCHHRAHLQIADLLTPRDVREFRDAVLDDNVDEVDRRLQDAPDLTGAEFTAGRGIASAIHHWRSTAMGSLLIDRGSDIEAFTTRGESPLAMQLRFGTTDGVRLLLDRGADPNKAMGGHMPTQSMVAMIELLLAHGWDINNGQLLHDANHGHGSRVQTWLRYGADPTKRDNGGRTALHLIAARGTGREALRALVDAGADINAIDEEGRSPLDLARLARSPVAARELVTLGAKDAPAESR